MNTFLIAAITIFALLVFNNAANSQPKNLTGAWDAKFRGNQSTMICSEKYFAVALYDLKEKKFVGTHGGSYRIEGNEFVALFEFHSMNPELVGTEVRNRIDLKDGGMTFTNKEEKTEWKRIDDGRPGKLAGAWLITGRIRDGQMGKMTPGARRTMKILSGTRFQWIAYNVDTKEFSGTGGGNYTTENGKYTENIEFFSRDNTRVGASLTFDFSIEDGDWRHKGKSSKGDPIDEVWTKREKIGL
jgi:hypothetical protein